MDNWVQQNPNDLEFKVKGQYLCKHSQSLTGKTIQLSNLLWNESHSFVENLFLCQCFENNWHFFLSRSQSVLKCPFVYNAKKDVTSVEWLHVLMKMVKFRNTISQKGILNDKSDRSNSSDHGQKQARGDVLVGF